MSGAAQSAFLHAAAAAAVGIEGVDLRVLADIVGVDRDERAGLRETLAAEGRAGGTGESLEVADLETARAALDGHDLEALLRALVRATGEAARTIRPLVSDRAIMTAGPVLSARLQATGMERADADRIACAIADEAARVLPDLLIMHAGRARTYRQAGAAEQADEILLGSLPDAPEKEDWADMARYFLSDVSEAHTDAGRAHEGVVAAGVAVADIPGLTPVSMSEARVALARMGKAAVALDGAPPQLLRAAAFIGRRVTPNWDKAAKDDFRRYEGMADDLNVPDCDAAGACQWLGEAVAASFSASDDLGVQDLLSRMFPDGVLGFSMLQRLVGR